MTLLLAGLLCCNLPVAAQAPALPPAAPALAATPRASVPNAAVAPRPYDAPSRRTRSWIYAAIAGTVGVVAVILLARHYHNNRGCGNCLANGN